MERRRELRIVCYQRGCLTVLNWAPREKPSCIPCRVVELSGRVVRIVADQPVPPGTPVSIESNDWLAFGEVGYALREYSHYAIGVPLDQVLLGLREFDALRRDRLNPDARRHNLSFVLDKTQQPVA